MATTKRNYRPSISEFVITRETIIGTVELNDELGRHPYQVAMGCIADYEIDHPEGGIYRFPIEDGRTATIDIEYTSERNHA